MDWHRPLRFKEEPRTFDLVIAGHITIDHIVIRGEARKPTLGGPPTYGGLAAKRLGASVSIVSKVGRDFPDDYFVWLGRMGIDLSGLRRDPDSLTTRYVLRYTDGERTLQLVNRCSPILPEDVAIGKTIAVHLAPCAGELTEETVKTLSKTADHVSLDSQGFVRRFDSKGQVRLGRWSDEEILKLVEVYRSSEDELLASTGCRNVLRAAEKIRKRGPRIIIAQRGALGSYILVDEANYSIPACKPRRVVDTTGAGDAFMGAFMAEYSRGGEPLWCAAIGSSSASFVVEGIGPSSFGSKEEVLERAKTAYPRIRKL